MTADGSAEAYWNGQAASFDDEPDHGLMDDDVRSAWSERFAGWMTNGPLRVVDLGCGTGSISLLLAQAGHRVVGVDLSAGMIERARIKARVAGASIRFVVGDASEPPFAPGAFDLVVGRHVVWALPDPAAALRQWAHLLTDRGRLIAVEGCWDGAGIGAADLTALVTPMFRVVEHHVLSDDPRLWGRPVHDERYAVVATSPTCAGTATQNMAPHRTERG